MEVKMKFYKTSEALPPKSGVYLVVKVVDGCVLSAMDVKYSAKHQGFNLNDSNEDRRCETFPDYWAHIPSDFENAEKEKRNDQD